MIARVQAQAQWNRTACGELDGERTSIEYFLRVEAERQRQQPWASKYFAYTEFSGQRILEIGVGQGTDLILFSKGGATCFGADITGNHLELTKRNFALRGERVGLVMADGVRLPFPDGYFDCVYSFGALHHVPEIEKVLSEARRVLRPMSGILMGAVYHKWSAFHLCSKIVGDGLRRGWLFTKGYRGLLATIESGADGVHVKPYVKLYGKRRVRHLLRGFKIEDVSVHQCCPDHFWFPPLVNVLAPVAPLLAGRCGWYVSFKARRAR